MKLLQTLILLFVIKQSFTQTNWDWAASGGKGTFSNSFSCGYSIAFDKNNNTYVTGSISTPAKIGAFPLTSFGGSDIFIAKYDTQGNLIWAKTAGAAYDDYGKSITIDKNGFIYTCGFVSGQSTFDSYSLNTNFANFFVAKLDSNGNYIWIKSGYNYCVTGLDADPNLLVAADSSDNVYFAGYCNNNAHLIDTIYLNSSNKISIFISQLDSSGAMNWTHFIRGNSGTSAVGNMGIDLYVDKFNDLIYTGSIPRVDTIINGPNSNTFYDNMLLGKINSSGNLLWSEEFGDTNSYAWGGHPKSITLDDNNNIYVCGTYYKSLLLNNSSLGTNGGFVSKFNSTNGSIVSAQSINPTNGPISWFTGCEYDYLGGVSYTGSCNGSIDFNGIIMPANNGDGFLVNYDTSGNFNWAIAYGFYDYERIQSSASNRNMYAVTGFFKDSIQFNQIKLFADTFNTSSAFYFVATKAIQSNINNISIPNSNINFSIYPNPSSDEIIIEYPEKKGDYIIDMYSEKLSIVLHESKQINKIDISNLPCGTYYIRITNKDISILKKIIKIN